jgi:hypothetical protein
MCVGLYCVVLVNDGDSGGESMTHQACRAQERVAHPHGLRRIMRRAAKDARE